MSHVPAPGGPAANRAGLGRLGERLAAHHLESRGYQILARNFRWRFGEIDLIAQRDDWLAFVEVRTRRGTAFGDPTETLTPRKRARLRATAEHYCQENEPVSTPNWRIDLIAVRFDGRGRLLDVEHLENVIEG